MYTPSPKPIDPNLPKHTDEALNPLFILLIHDKDETNVQLLDQRDPGLHPIFCAALCHYSVPHAIV